MTYPLYIREKAQQLRREKKMTIDEIAECLAISRTTIYYWVRDMPIPRTPRQIAAARQLNGVDHRGRRIGNHRMQLKYRKLREAAYEEGELLYHEHFEAEHGFRDFVCMYIGEGYKRSRNTVSVANSDPAVVKLADYWLKRLSRNRVTYEIQHHADQDPDELRRFWSGELGCDPESIRIQRKSTATNSLDASGAAFMVSFR